MIQFLFNILIKLKLIKFQLLKEMENIKIKLKLCLQQKHQLYIFHPNFFIFYFLRSIKMIGIGHRLQKQTKIKILAERAKQYNQKYQTLVGQGFDPQIAVKTLTQEQFKNRHQQAQQEIEPYKNSSKINGLGGAINLGFTETHKVKTSTKAMMQTVDEGFKSLKSGSSSNGFKLTKSPEQIHEMKKIKERIKKDHLAQDKQIDLGEQKLTDYKRNFQQSQKMQQICENKDMKFNQRKNDLKWYAQTYIKTKDSLRGK